MRMRLRTAVLLAATGALLIGAAVPAGAQTSVSQTSVAQPGPSQPALATWSPDLVAGETSGVVVEGGTARLDHAGTHLLPSDADGSPVPTGLLTLPTHRLDAPTDRVETALVGELPAGSAAVVDVRGRRASGGWTEWIPASAGSVVPPASAGSVVPPTSAGSVLLPESVSEVQGRLVLTGDETVEPTVERLTLTAHPAAARAESAESAAALNYRVFATREGLAGFTTANGHVIAERDHFVALPSRRALSPRGTSDYSVKVCAPNGRCAFAPVWDVGPWNTRDDYWNPADQRQEWRDLPQGLPQAQAAFEGDYNGGRDQYQREVANPAGIDLGDGLFWDALALKDNSWVTVDYLWTGSIRLSSVESDEPVDVLAAPDAAAEVVGVAADRAALPVECVLAAGEDTWLRIGEDQYVGAGSVPDADDVAPCDAPGAPADADDPTDGRPTTGPADAGEPSGADAGDPAAAVGGIVTDVVDATLGADDPTAGQPTAGQPTAPQPNAPQPDSSRPDSRQPSGVEPDGGAADGGAADESPVDDTTAPSADPAPSAAG